MKGRNSILPGFGSIWGTPKSREIDFGLLEGIAPVVICQGGEHMVFPATVDEQVIASKTLGGEAQLLQDVAAPDIVWHVVGHDAVQIHHLECVLNRMAKGFFHKAVTLFVFGKTVADVAVLSDATHDIVEVDEAYNGVRFLLKDEELERLVRAELVEIDFKLQSPSLQVKEIAGPTRSGFLQMLFVAQIKSNGKLCFVRVEQSQIEPRSLNYGRNSI